MPASGVFVAPAKTTTKPIAAKSSTGAYSDTARALTSMAWMKKSGVTSPPFNPGSDVTTVNTLFSFQFYGCAPPSRKADTPKRTNDRDGVRRRIGRAKTEVVTGADERRESDHDRAADHLPFPRHGDLSRDQTRQGTRLFGKQHADHTCGDPHAEELV